LENKIKVWCGLPIKKITEFKNIQLIISEYSVALIFRGRREGEELFNIFITLKFFFEKTNPELVLGVLLLPNLIIKKKKMKKEIISAFSRENLTAALTPSNPEAYYSNNETFEEMLGIELRYEKKVETWLEEEKVLGAILNKISEQKKKYKNSSIY
jgi:hypothetical protein